MKTVVLIFGIGLLLASCRQKESGEVSRERTSSDQVFQYSLFTALANKIYKGTLTVGKLKEKGNLGLGSFNGLNGEMIVLDGIVYQSLADNTIREPENNELITFTTVTFFENDRVVALNEVADYDVLKEKIKEELPYLNYIYAFRIKGEFKYIKCGGAEKQEEPYSKTLNQVLVNRPVFEAENVNGTLVGFWFPEYIGNVNVVGFHLHFIADDKSIAGHVIEFRSANLLAGIDYVSGLEIQLPETEEFRNTSFDLSLGYN